MLKSELAENDIRMPEWRGDPGNGTARLAWLHRRFIARVTAFGLLIFVTVALLIPNRYESTARLMPPDSGSTNSLLMAAGVLGMNGSPLGAITGDLLKTSDRGALFIGVMRSRIVQDRIITRFDLRRAYRTSLWQQTREKLAEYTVISQDRKSGIISVTVTDSDRNRAAEICRAYLEELDRVIAEVSTSSAGRERRFLETRLEGVKRDLESSSKALAAFSSKNAILDVKEQGKAMVDAAAKLQAELIAAQSQLSGLEQIYTSENVRVRSLRARIGELRTQLGNIQGSTSESAGAGISNDDDTPYPSIRKLPALGVTYLDLYRTVRVQEAVFEILTKQFEIAKVEEAKQIPTVKVLDEPDVPERKSGPPRLLVVIGGLFFTFSFAVAVVVLKRKWNQVPEEDPRRQLVMDVVEEVRSSRIAVQLKKILKGRHFLKRSAKGGGE